MTGNHLQRAQELAENGGLLPNETQQKGNGRSKKIATLIRGADLFCGVGGLTRGLEATGINVGLGIDIDPACEYPYTANNKASFLLKSIEEITTVDHIRCFRRCSLQRLSRRLRSCESSHSST